MEKFSDDKGGWQKHVRIYTFSINLRPMSIGERQSSQAVHTQ